VKMPHTVNVRKLAVILECDNSRPQSRSFKASVLVAKGIDSSF
jgi:hypothetical protein